MYVERDLSPLRLAAVLSSWKERIAALCRMLASRVFLVYSCAQEAGTALLSFPRRRRT